MTDEKWDEEMAELREGTNLGNKIEDTEPEQEFIDTIAAVLDEIDGDRGARVVTANDPNLWALFTALDMEDGKRREFCDALGIEYDTETLNRSAALKKLVRCGLEEIEGNFYEEVGQAIKKHEDDDPW